MLGSYSIFSSSIVVPSFSVIVVMVVLSGVVPSVTLCTFSLSLAFSEFMFSIAIFSVVLLVVFSNVVFSSVSPFVSLSIWLCGISISSAMTLPSASIILLNVWYTDTSYAFCMVCVSLGNCISDNVAKSISLMSTCASSGIYPVTMTLSSRFVSSGVSFVSVLLVSVSLVPSSAFSSGSFSSSNSLLYNVTVCPSSVITSFLS